MRLAICARCGKLAKIFSHYGRCKDLPMCYVCYYREYRQRNRERFRGYYRKNRAKIIARQKAYRQRKKRTDGETNPL